MATIDAYDTKAGRRWRVIYRKSDGTQTSRRGSRRKRDAQEWLAEHVTIAKASGSFIDPAVYFVKSAFRVGTAAMTLDVYADLFDSDLDDVARVIDATVDMSGDRTWSKYGQDTPSGILYSPERQ